MTRLPYGVEFCTLPVAEGYTIAGKLALSGTFQKVRCVACLPHISEVVFVAYLVSYMTVWNDSNLKRLWKNGLPSFLVDPSWVSFFKLSKRALPSKFEFPPPLPPLNLESQDAPAESLAISKMSQFWDVEVRTKSVSISWLLDKSDSRQLMPLAEVGKIPLKLEFPIRIIFNAHVCWNDLPEAKCLAIVHLFALLKALFNAVGSHRITVSKVLVSGTYAFKAV